MVVASTLAFLVINDKLERLTKGQLVEMAMENEQRVGRSSIEMFHKCALMFLSFDFRCK